MESNHDSKNGGSVDVAFEWYDDNDPYTTCDPQCDIAVVTGEDGKLVSIPCYYRGRAFDAATARRVPILVPMHPVDFPKEEFTISRSDHGHYAEVSRWPVHGTMLVRDLFDRSTLVKVVMTPGQFRDTLMCRSYDQVEWRLATPFVSFGDSISGLMSSLEMGGLDFLRTVPYHETSIDVLRGTFDTEPEPAAEDRGRIRDMGATSVYLGRGLRVETGAEPRLNVPDDMLNVADLFL